MKLVFAAVPGKAEIAVRDLSDSAKHVGGAAGTLRGIIYKEVLGDSSGQTVFRPERTSFGFSAPDLIRILRQMGTTVDAKPVAGIEEKIEKAVAEQTAVLSAARAIRLGDGKVREVKKPRVRKAKK